MGDQWTERPSSEAVQQVLRWLLGPESEPYKRRRQRRDCWVEEEGGDAVHNQGR